MKLRLFAALAIMLCAIGCSQFEPESEYEGPLLSFSDTLNFGLGSEFEVLSRENTGDTVWVEVDTDTYKSADSTGQAIGEAFAGWFGIIEKEKLVGGVDWTRANWLSSDGLQDDRGWVPNTRLGSGGGSPPPPPPPPPPPSGDATGVNLAGVSNMGEKTEGFYAVGSPWESVTSTPDDKNWMGKCSLMAWGDPGNDKHSRCWGDLDVNLPSGWNRILWEIGIARRLGGGGSSTPTAAQIAAAEYTAERMRNELSAYGVPESDIVLYVTGLNEYPQGHTCKSTGSQGDHQAQNVAVHLAGTYSWVELMPDFGGAHVFAIGSTSWLEGDGCHYAPDGDFWPNVNQIPVNSGTYFAGGQLAAAVDWIMSQ